MGIVDCFDLCRGRWWRGVEELVYRRVEMTTMPHFIAS